jgi:hypothetical protein
MVDGGLVILVVIGRCCFSRASGESEKTNEVAVSVFVLGTAKITLHLRRHRRQTRLKLMGFTKRLYVVTPNKV